MDELPIDMGSKFMSFEHFNYRKKRSRSLRAVLTGLKLKKRKYDRILCEISLYDDPGQLRSISRKIEALAICIHLLENKVEQLSSGDMSCHLG